MKPIKNYIFNNQEKAFTLIELLVVIAIIGILSSVVLASLQSARIRANRSKFLSDMRSVQQALELYYQEHGEYPENRDPWGIHIGRLLDEYLHEYVGPMSEYDIGGYFRGEFFIGHRFGNLSKRINVQLSSANGNNPSYPDSYPVVYVRPQDWINAGYNVLDNSCGDIPIRSLGYFLYLSVVDNSNVPDYLLPYKVGGEIYHNNHYMYCLPVY